MLHSRPDILSPEEIAVSIVAELVALRRGAVVPHLRISEALALQLKDVTPEHLVAAVQLVRTGDALLAPSITRRLVERFAAAPDTAARGKPARAARPAGRAGAACGTSQLTPREMEVLGLVARGLSNAEIASELTLSEATVKTHVARILTKLSLRDRVQAVVLAYETGLVSPATGTLPAWPASRRGHASRWCGDVE